MYCPQGGSHAVLALLIVVGSGLRNRFSPLPPFHHGTDKDRQETLVALQDGISQVA